MTDSIYDQLNAHGTVAKQRFVETFSGDALDTDRWATTLVSGTVSMSDSVDGGIKLSTSGVNQKATIHFNGKKQYAHNGSVLLSVFKFDSTQASTIQSIGFVDVPTDGARTYGANSAGFSDVVNQGIIYVDHGDGSGAVINTNSGVSVDTNWHVGKITLDGSSLITQIDGVAIGSTITTDLPTTRLQPVAHIDSGVTKNLLINYMECYNT